MTLILSNYACRNDVFKMHLCIYNLFFIYIHNFIISLDGNDVVHAVLSSCEDFHATEILTFLSRSVPEYPLFRMNWNNRSSLHRAVSRKLHKSLEILLGSEKCSREDVIDMQDIRGNTALHEAVFLNDRIAARMLLEHGASCEIDNLRREKALGMCRDDTMQELVLGRAELMRNAEKERARARVEVDTEEADVQGYVESIGSQRELHIC